jgi:hypothetical protein
MTEADRMWLISALGGILMGVGYVHVSSVFSNPDPSMTLSINLTIIN